jgi:hypothetical protein
MPYPADALFRADSVTSRMRHIQEQVNSTCREIRTLNQFDSDDALKKRLGIDLRSVEQDVPVIGTDLTFERRRMTIPQGHSETEAYVAVGRVTFKGDRTIFQWRPDGTISNPPRAEIVHPDKLVFYAVIEQDDIQKAKDEISAQVVETRRILDGIKKAVDEAVAQWKNQINEAYEIRVKDNKNRAI